MRPGEYEALQWKDVDFQNRTVTVQRSLDNKREIRETKTAKSRRNIQMIPALSRVLAEHKRRQAEYRLASTSFARARGRAAIIPAPLQRSLARLLATTLAKLCKAQHQLQKVEHLIHLLSIIGLSCSANTRFALPSVCRWLTPSPPALPRAREKGLLI